MRTVAMALVTTSVLIAAGCSTATGLESAAEPEPVETTQAAAAQSAEPSFWDLAPLGDGEHIKVQVEDRAKASDCSGLNDLFERIVADDSVEGYTDEALAYIDTHRTAAKCDGTESGASPSPSVSASLSADTQW